MSLDLRPLSLSSLLRVVLSRPFHPPMQEDTAVKLLRSAQWVSSDPSARAYGRRAEALAPGLRSLKWLLRRSRQGGHASSLRSLIGYYGGVGSAGSAEDTTGTTAVMPWGSTPHTVTRRALRVRAGE